MRTVVTSVAKRRLPSICIDEHLPPEVKTGFQAEGFRVIRANESRYKSVDERHFLGQMYARNEVFATADGEFVDDLAESGLRRHAGIVWLPKQMDREQRTGFVELAATVIKLQVKEDGPFGMRGLLLYPEQTGVRIFDGAKDHLIISWDRLAS
jgi:hypothetical protein